MGQLNKSVTVTSTDSTNLNATIRVLAKIELDFDFEIPNLYMGRIGKSDTVTKSAFIGVKGSEKIKILNVTSSSPYITAREVSLGADSGSSRIKIEVILRPGLLPGNFNESITVHSDLARKPEAKLYVSGTVPGDIDIEPRSMNFLIAGPPGSSNERTDSLFITDNLPKKDLEIESVRDADNHLQLKLTTEQPGWKFKLKITLKDQGVPKEGLLNGSIVITTNNPDFKEITVPYSAVWQK